MKATLDNLGTGMPWCSQRHESRILSRQWAEFALKESHEFKLAYEHDERNSSVLYYVYEQWLSEWLLTASFLNKS